MTLCFSLSAISASNRRFEKKNDNKQKINTEKLKFVCGIIIINEGKSFSGRISIRMMMTGEENWKLSRLLLVVVDGEMARKLE